MRFAVVVVSGGCRYAVGFPTRPATRPEEWAQADFYGRYRRVELPRIGAIIGRFCLFWFLNLSVYVLIAGYA